MPLGNRKGVSATVGRPPDDLERPLVWVSGVNLARHANRLLAKRGKFIEKRHTDTDRVVP